jgi:hypothetical protein
VQQLHTRSRASTEATVVALASRSRLEDAARRHGSWSVVGTNGSGPQDFISEELELFLVIYYRGGSVQTAKLWDLTSIRAADGGPPFQQITAADRDKTARIETVLLGRSRQL